jgi:ligand-binding sensor domain-containing protein/two-component sensor histidine kinase
LPASIKNIHLLNIILRTGIFFPLFVLFFYQPLFSQNFSFYISNSEHLYFTSLTTDDGLSYNSVSKVFQDSKGFIWIGTYNGLNRFDGYSIKQFFPIPGKNSIASQSILALCEDKSGNIWIGTNNGLSKYDPKSEKFTNYYHDPKKNNSISNNVIFSFLSDANGNLWVGTLNGLSRYNPRTNDFTSFLNVAETTRKKFNSVNSLTEDCYGNIWAGTWDGITCFKKDGSRQYIKLPQTGVKNNPKSEVISIIEDNQHNLWFGTRLRGLFRYNIKSGEFHNYICIPGKDNALSSNFVKCILQDSQHNLWIGTNKGINKYNYDSDDFAVYQNNPEEPLSLSSDKVLSMYQDKTGVLWIGTDYGINKCFLSKHNSRFIPVYSPDSQNGNSVNSITKDFKNNLWLGTRSGIFLVKSGSQEASLFSSPAATSNDFVYNIKHNKNGSLWVSTNRGGLINLDPVSGKILKFNGNKNDPNSLDNDIVLSFAEAKDEKFWVGTWNCVAVFDPKDRSFKKLKQFDNNLTWNIIYDKKGTLWISSSGMEMFNYNPSDKSRKRYLVDTANKSHFPASRILSLCESRDGNIWIGTLDGLSKFDRKLGKIVCYNISDGLISSVINSVIEDNRGNIWLGTDKGISVFDKNKNTFRNFTRRDGLADIKCSSRAVFKDNNGMLFFGVSHGVIYFNPDEILSDVGNTSVIFTDIKINNRSLTVSGAKKLSLPLAVPYNRQVQLPFSNAITTIEFALTDYVNIRNNHFMYKLVGMDYDWIDAGTRNSATYTSLPPGEYTLLVKAYTENGFAGGNVASLHLIIIPAFYQTFGFKVLLLVLFILVIVFIINYRTKTIKNQNLLLAKKVNEHTKYLDKTIADLNLEISERKKAEALVKASLEEKEILLKEIHHRVKNNLQIISSLLYLQSTKAKDEETLNLFEDSQNRIKSMALIHEKLYQSKDFAEVNFNEYVCGLLVFLNKSLNNSGVNIKTKINIHDIHLDLDTAISCGLIINELITNSFKYAFPASFVQAGAADNFIIEVGIIKEENNYILTVYDNGVGIKEDLDIKKADTLGLKLVNSMVRQLDGSIEIARDKGTLFKIVFS